MNGTFENINRPIHATGVGLLLFALDKYSNNHDDLIKQIINDKIGVKDIFNETLKVDKNSKVIPFKEKANVGLYMIGPTLMESFGDAVAANKVSMQGLNLAKLLANQVS